MKIFKTGLSLSIALGLIACQSSEVTLQKADELELAHLLNRKALQFEARLAEPFSRQTLVANKSNGTLWQFGTIAGFVDLNGQDFFLTLEGDSVKAVLPYYHQKEQFRNMYGRNWIELNYPISELSYWLSPNRRLADIRFDVQDQTERFQVQIRLFGNQRAEVTVNSAQRDRIKYRGAVRGTVIEGAKGR